MPVDVTAILVSSTFMGAGLALAKFFPESSLLAAFFLGGLALVNIALSIAGCAPWQPRRAITVEARVIRARESGKGKQNLNR